MNEKDEKLQVAIAGLMKDPHQRRALAELLIEYIQPNHLTNQFMSVLLDSRALKPGDALVKKVRKGIKVYTHTPGAIPLKSEITVEDRINYILDTAIVGVTANEWDLESGELGSIESIKQEAMAKLKDYYFNKVFTALSTIWNEANTADNYQDVGGSLTSGALKAAIDRINTTTSGAKAVIGLRSALQPITEFGTSWSDGTSSNPIDSKLQEVMDIGWIGRYYGVPIIALNQEYDNLADYNALLPADKVLVIGEKVGEFITFGPERQKEWTDPRPTPPQWNFDLFAQFGFIIDNAEGIYVLKVA